jgi:hypothetical protein
MSCSVGEGVSFNRAWEGKLQASVARMSIMTGANFFMMDAIIKE